MTLRPREIRFTQNSIDNVFDENSNHRNVFIGQTLDNLLLGRCQISDIPTITVIRRNGHWFTVDNRRLWVFQKLEELGNRREIPVRIGYTIPFGKLSTSNDGVSVHVRGDPGGVYWKLKKRSAQVLDAGQQFLPLSVQRAQHRSALPNRQPFQAPSMWSASGSRRINRPSSLGTPLAPNWSAPTGLSPSTSIREPSMPSTRSTSTQRCFC